MYTREEDVFNAIYRQLKGYVNEHYITNSAYKQKIQEYTGQIADLTQRKTTAWINAMEHYEKEISKEKFRTVQAVANQAKGALIQATDLHINVPILDPDMSEKDIAVLVNSISGIGAKHIDVALLHLMNVGKMNLRRYPLDYSPDRFVSTLLRRFFV